MVFAIFVSFTRIIFWTCNKIVSSFAPSEAASNTIDIPLDAEGTRSSISIDDPLLARLTDNPKSLNTGDTATFCVEDLIEDLTDSDMASSGDGYRGQGRGRSRGRGSYSHPWQSMNPEGDRSPLAQAPNRPRGRGYNQGHFNHGPRQPGPRHNHNPYSQNNQQYRQSPRHQHTPANLRQEPYYQHRPADDRQRQWNPLSADEMAQPNTSHPSPVYDELYELESLWKQKNNRLVVSKLKQYLQSTTTPYTDCLSMLNSCSDPKDMKTVSLSYTIAKEFSQWISANRSKVPESLNEELQQKALEIASSRERTVSAQLLDCMADAFKLTEVNYLAHPFCTKLLDKGKMKVSPCAWIHVPISMM